MNDTSHILPCVMIPMSERQLLLPNVSVAEIVDCNHIEARDDAPVWLLGDLDWRGQRLPVISYDAANGGEARMPTGNRGRIAVLNTIGKNHGSLPFLAVVTQGIPSQTRLASDQVQTVDDEAGPADLMMVTVEGEHVSIPNLEYLEQLALEAARTH